MIEFRHHISVKENGCTLCAYIIKITLHLRLLSQPWLIVDMQPAKVFPIGITLGDIHLNVFNGFHFLILTVGSVVTVIGCKIFLTPFLNVIRISSMSTVSFPVQLQSGIICLKNVSFDRNDLNIFKTTFNTYILSSFLSFGFLSL